jgi:uncharacterized protein
MASASTRALFLLAVTGLIALAGCGGRAAAGPAAQASSGAAPGAAASKAEASAARRAARAHPPPGYVRMIVGGVAPTPQGNAVLLSDERGSVGLPIFVGEGEALSILVRLRQHPHSRPLTHDLFDSVLRRLGGSIDSVRIDSVRNNVFFATVNVRGKSGPFAVDSRASDAIAVALGNNAPIFVAKQVIQAAGIDVRGLRKRRGNQPPAEGDPGHLKL